MKKQLSALMIAIGAILLLVAILWILHNQERGSSAILVEATPDANVYVNGELVGKTPYEGEYPAGEISLELIPLAFDSPRVPFDANIKLTSGVRTIVRREQGETNNTSTGEIISYEQTSGVTAVTVVTKPDNSLVMLDGHESEASPVRFADITEGEHRVVVSASGYEDRTFTIVVKKGYTTTALVDLKKKPAEEKSIQNQAVTIQVLETPVGFLRVREQPSVESKEVGQVAQSEQYEVLEKSTDSNWYKIRIDDDTEGWVSSEYTEEVIPQEQE